MTAKRKKIVVSVETPYGETFSVPFNNPEDARAYARLIKWDGVKVRVQGDLAGISEV